MTNENEAQVAKMAIEWQSTNTKKKKKNDHQLRQHLDVVITYGLNILVELLAIGSVRVWHSTDFEITVWHTALLPFPLQIITNIYFDIHKGESQKKRAE